jgi:hypothetical protein
MPVYKPYDLSKVGAVVDTNYKFLSNLFGEQKAWGTPGQLKTLRDHLLSLPDEATLRAVLKDEGLNVEPPAGDTRPVRLVLFDVESAQVRKFQPDINVANELFYVLVLPPALRRETVPARKEVHIESQSWTGAYYHAVSDGYGM